MNRPTSLTLACCLACLPVLAAAPPPAHAAEAAPPPRDSAPPPTAPATATATSAAAATSASAPAPKSTTYSARYRVHYLDRHAAEQLAWDQCAGKECRVTWQAGDLDLAADSATHEKLARALVRADEPRTQSFQLTMLAADRTAGGMAPELPKPAQQALADLKDFLPYTSYRLLDIAWLRTTSSAEAHLVGDRDTPYSAELYFTSIGDPEARELLVENFLLRAAVVEGSRPAPAAAKPAPEAPARSWKTLIKTTFSMHVGETVVVGTSKLGGDTSALVVLLTAVPDPAATRTAAASH
jgi:hypothetical protein